MVGPLQVGFKVVSFPEPLPFSIDASFYHGSPNDVQSVHLTGFRNEGGEAQVSAMFIANRATQS